MKIQSFTRLSFAIPALVLALTACGRPAGVASDPVSAPSPTNARSIVVSTATPMPPSPTSLPTPSPSASASATPTAAETAPAATAQPAMHETEPPAVASETAVAIGSGGVDACPAAHAAEISQSTDLSAQGRALAPTLGSFNQYRLDLVLEPDKATLYGVQTLVYTNHTGQPLPDLVFHLYPNLGSGDDADAEMEFEGRLDVICAAVDGTTITPAFEDSRFLLRLPLPAPLPPEQTASVTLHFVSESPRDSETAYPGFSATDDLWTLASFYPILAIRIGDAWDTKRPNGWSDFVNSDAALYHVQAALPEAWQLLASGTGQMQCSAGRCQTSIAAGPQREFTISLVSGWQQLSQTIGETTVVSSFPPDEREAGQRALDLSVDAIHHFNQAFGLYPYTELDVLPIPIAGFAGVEYPGIIMISDAYYTDPTFAHSYLLDVVVHEVAHQWWYNVVGNDVLREPWLDEGLASYSAEYVYTERSGQGERPVTKSRVGQLRQRNLHKKPIDTPVDEFSDAGAYVAVVYTRAPLFFDALRGELGDETFFRLLREYYARYAFKRATTAEFTQLTEEVAGRQLDTLFGEWLKPGTP